ncbi:Aste57867_15024 [Aphanomyces stellatus]|uniref:Aste57867_15024 protein n=1 Tax=Aphanomyces stellatus TaxID=120398 RepID=A0A485L2R6_9STRA|nr:hypothetical protein As57867_014968 [Aphanomyces stellatus]VFT91838.1 Aste57867_15024 [Aphanomyces stellatus]
MVPNMSACPVFSPIFDLASFQAMHRALHLLFASFSVAAAACPYNSLPSDVTNVCAYDKTECQSASLTRPCVLDRQTCAIVPGGDCNAVGSYADCNSTFKWSFGMCVDRINGPFYVQELTMTPNIQRLDFYCLAVVLPPTMKWPPNLHYLYFNYANLTSIPPVPPTVVMLGLEGNLLRESSELAKLSKEIIYVAIPNNTFTELTNLDWAHLNYAYLNDNKNLRRIQNVSFGENLLTLYDVAPRHLFDRFCSDLTNLYITSWVMSNATYKLLETRLTPEHPQQDTGFAGNIALAGYMVNGTIINSDQGECDQLKGSRVELWSKTSRNRFSINANQKFMVCVLSDAVPSTSTGLSSGAIVGIIAGVVVVVVGLLGFYVIMRRRQRQTKQELDKMRDLYQITQTPELSQGEEEGLNMQELTLCRLDQNDLQLQRKLGSGAFADVWLATFQGESVAVKKLNSSKVTVNQLHSFIDEIKLMATFDSPYIVKLIGAAWTRPSDVKCVMELMEGGDLKDFLDRHNADEFTWNDKYMDIHSIVEGLVYLHSLNIIHRDIKSRNVLMDPKKCTKLTDFGISKEDMQATMTMGIGTFRWMAPEVIQDQSYTIAADIYSFGMLLSEFDTHHIPYEDLKNPTNGQPISDSAIMVKVVGGTIKPTFTPNCPPWILEIAMQCLSYNPADRPTAMQLSHIVRSKLKELSSGMFSLLKP